MLWQIKEVKRAGSPKENRDGSSKKKELEAENDLDWKKGPEDLPFPKKKSGQAVRRTWKRLEYEFLSNNNMSRDYETAAIREWMEETRGWGF